MRSRPPNIYLLHHASVSRNGLLRQPTSRSDIFITSKLHPRNQSYEGAKKAVADSLIELETDYIDLYLIHWPGTSKLKPENPANAENRRTSWEALETVYREEKCLRGILEFDVMSCLGLYLGRSFFRAQDRVHGLKSSILVSARLASCNGPMAR